MIMKALIDGDILCYSIGFATQEEPHVKAAIRTTNIMIENICEATAADEYEVFLTGKGNYRETVATIKEYKGTRKADKPKYYQAIKDHLLKKHEAILCEGYEADDAMAMSQTFDTVICTLDKDLMMVEGMHYNWRKDKRTYVTPLEGILHFYTQMLTGDTTDNIQGCYGVGPKKAKTLLDKCTTPDEMKCVVGLQYASCKYRGKEYEDPEKAFEENARLLWMSRETIDDWSWDV